MKLNLSPFEQTIDQSQANTVNSGNSFNISIKSKQLPVSSLVQELMPDSPNMDDSKKTLDF